ncbi:MAG: sugar phosphate nucleotidyltransferase [Chitinophagales bacterium]|nr:sugar phosphate nucleotidyltransferase [Chitinophagales bacterium]
MKAIIPVAGAGTRLRPHTYTQPKALIPVAGKPILGFIIEQLMEVGYTDFIFVVGYLGDKIRDFVESKYPHIKSQFVLQEQREGLGHAIWLARDMVAPGEDILIMLGDTIIEADLPNLLKGANSMLGVKKVPDPWKFGVAEFGEGDSITKVVEKPKFPKSNMALVGVYRIKESKELFEALSILVKAEERRHGEIHLTDAIMMMIEKGIKFTSFKIDNWYDCGKPEILLETNAKLLKKFGFASAEVPFYENTIIIHPVSIAKGTRITNSIVGPNVTIGEQSEIQYSILSNSIIGDFARLHHVILKKSVVGSDAFIKGLSQSLNIGDNTEIDLSGDVNPNYEKQDN